MFHTEVVEKMKTHFYVPVTFFPESSVVYEIMWRNMVEPDMPQVTI